MINLERLDIFLSQSIIMRYGAILTMLLLVLLTSYYAFIAPLNAQSDYLQLNSQALADDIVELDEKILHYSTYEQLFAENQQLTEQLQQKIKTSVNIATLLHEKLLGSQLKLIDLSSRETVNSTDYQIQTQGNYQNIIAFIGELAAQTAYIDINHIIIMNDNNILSFYLSITDQSEMNKL